jgi:hypothetical protein
VTHESTPKTRLAIAVPLVRGTVFMRIGESWTRQEE